VANVLAGCIYNYYGALNCYQLSHLTGVSQTFTVNLIIVNNCKSLSSMSSFSVRIHPRGFLTTNVIRTKHSVINAMGVIENNETVDSSVLTAHTHNVTSESIKRDCYCV